MPHFNRVRPFAIASLFTLAATFSYSPPARAEGYAGVMAGLGIPMGTNVNLDSGMVLGATLGARLLPLMSIAATYLHDGLKMTNTNLDYKVDQYLAELNFFSLFFMNAGIHAGSVNTKFLGVSSSDLGYGLHLGFDFKLTDQVSIGGAGYLTYVTANNKYATLNLMVPLKIWF